MSHEVFICHASEDKAIADAVCAFLEQERIPAWIAPRDILPADDYGKSIVEAITSSRLVVLVFSSSANASPHIRRELELAVSNGIPILPFRVEDEVPSESLQYYLGGIHWLDALTPPLEAHLRHLAGTVRVLLDRNEPTLRGNRAAGAVAGSAAATPATPATGTGPPAGPAPSPTPPAPSSPTGGPAPQAGPPSPAVPPPGRTSVLRWVLIGLGALVLVAGAGIALALALAGGGAEPDEAGTDSGSAEDARTDDSSAADEEAALMALSERSCELLDPADVTAVYGADADTGTPAGDGYCDFAAFESITIYEDPSDAESLAQYRELTTGEVTDLPELGGGAFQDEFGTLTVFDEGRGVLLVLITGGSTQADYQRLVDLAELVVADG
ncbi:MAG TPA: toll/interleukin-1 receptor domain-containing protein [Agromyces sp.]